MSKNSTDDSGTDYFGFKNEYNRSVDYPVYPVNPISLSKRLMTIGIIVLVILVVVMYGFTGYIAWNGFTNDPLWLKMGKTYIAILFAPLFLFYIFMRSVIFKLP